MTDVELIKRIQNGNTAAFKHIYKHKPLIQRMVSKKGGTKEDGEDVFQNTLIILVKKLSNADFILTSKLSTFLYSIAVYAWYKMCTKMKDGSLEDILDLKTVEDEYFKSENTDMLKKCVSVLSNHERKLVDEFYFKQKSIPELTEELGYNNDNTTKNMKYKAVRKLEKAVLDEYVRDDFFYK